MVDKEEMVKLDKSYTLTAEINPFEIMPQPGDYSSRYITINNVQLHDWNFQEAQKVISIQSYYPQKVTFNKKVLFIWNEY